jgi:hypothetical protein
MGMSGEATQKRSLFEIVSDAMKGILVQIYDNAEGYSDPFKSGMQAAIEEVSFRAFGEDFDTYEETVRAKLKEEQLRAVARDFEEALDAAVAEGKYMLIVEADGTKKYSKLDRGERGG